MPIIADVKDHFALSFAAMNSPNYLEAYILKENGVYLVVKATLPATYENGAFERVSGNSDPYELVFSDGSKLYRDKVVPNNASRTIEIHFLLLPEMANKTIDEVSSSTSSTRMYVHVSYAGRNPVTYFSSRGFGLLVDPAWFNSTPSLTLTSPANNQTLVEGNTYPIAGTATDADSGNVVTVKYKIDNGTAYNLTASVSDGTTPINFSKTLTYLNNRLYDGQNPVTPILDENVTHTLTVWAEDDQGGKSPDTTRNFTVLYNQPPQISGSDQDLGTITTPPSINYTVTDPEGYTFTVKEAVDGNTIRTFPGVNGQQETLTIPLEMWITLEPGVTHQLTITATDQYNATSVRTYTFIRAVEGIELETTEILPADAQPSRVILSLNGTIPANANLNVQVCNNAHDPSPTWEDMTQSVINGRPYVFTNTTSTTGQWGIRFKIRILPGA